MDVVIDKLTNIPPTSLAIALLAIVATIAYYVFTSRGLPPGPAGVPILGYYPFLNDKECHQQLDNLKKKYGDIFSFTVTGHLYIHLGSVKAIREVHQLKADCFGPRPTLLQCVFGKGIGLVSGEPWKVLRKFFLPILKERGMTTAKDNMTGPLYDSINSTIEHFRAKNGEAINISEYLVGKCSEVLCHALFAESVTGQQIEEINAHFGNVVENVTSTVMLLAGNIGNILFHVLPGTRKSLKYHRLQASLIYKIIDDHKSSYDEGNVRDVIDEYFKERDERRRKGDPTAEYLTDEALMGSLIQFISDSVLSLAIFVATFLKSSADHPEEQEKVYEELVEVIGKDRPPTIDDKRKLIYTNAFILEVLRQSDFFPLNPSQVCTKETTVLGYRIPVGAITLPNYWSAHFDPNTYEEPKKFDPSRFMPSKDKKRPEIPVSFGIGRRACIGEGFAMIQVFLYLTAIIQNFRLTVPNTTGGTIFDMVSSGVQICAHPRDKK